MELELGYRPLFSSVFKVVFFSQIFALFYMGLTFVFVIAQISPSTIRNQVQKSNCKTWRTGGITV